MVLSNVRTSEIDNNQLAQGPADYAFHFTHYAMLQCSNFLPIMLKIMLNIYASVPMFYTLWIDNKWLKPCHRKDQYTLIQQSGT